MSKGWTKDGWTKDGRPLILTPSIDFDQVNAHINSTFSLLCQKDGQRMALTWLVDQNYKIVKVRGQKCNNAIKSKLIKD
jgi:hypothetical protein